MFSHLSDLKKAGLFYLLVMALNVTQILIFRAAAPEAEIGFCTVGKRPFHPHQF